MEQKQTVSFPEMLVAAVSQIIGKTGKVQK